MQFLSANEYAVITLGSDGTLRGGRFKTGKKSLAATHLAELAPSEKELADRLKELIRELDLGSAPLLIASAIPDGSSFFNCRTADMPTRALASSLVFDAQQQILQLPADFRMQFSTRKTDVPGEIEANVMLFPSGGLAAFFAAFGKNRRRIDEFVYPLLALPELPAGEKVKLPEFSAEFYWQDGSFHPAPERPHDYNAKLLELIRKEVTLGEKFSAEAARTYNRYLTLCLLARFAASPDFRRHRAGLALLPDFLRPRRYRSQLRIGAALLIILIAMYAAIGFKSFHRNYQEYAGLDRAVKQARNTAKNIQTRLKTRDRETKEIARIMELKPGQYHLVSHIADISNTLPPEVLVSSMRWNENGVDMTMQTAMENPDLAPFVQKLPNYKIASLQHRQTGDTLVTITLKLETVPGAVR